MSKVCRMNILMTVSSYFDYGGVERHILELSRGLIERGHKVVIVSGDGLLVKESNQLGIKHFTLPFKFLNPFSYLETLRRLTKIINEFNIDILHAHRQTSALFCYQLSKNLNIPYIISVHGFWPKPYRCFTYYLSDRMIAVSPLIKRYLTSVFRIEKDRIKVIVNGIDFDTFNNTSPFNSTSRRDFNLVYVGRLARKKGKIALKLIRQMAVVTKHIPSAKLLVVGGGAMLQRCREISKGSPNTKILGSGDNISEVYRQANVVLGCGRVILEAMACEVPVIAVLPKGYRGIITPDKFMEFYGFEKLGIKNLSRQYAERKKDNKLLLQDLLAIYQDDYKDVVLKNAENVRKYFSLTNMIKQIEAEYEKILEERRGV